MSVREALQEGAVLLDVTAATWKVMDRLHRATVQQKACHECLHCSLCSINLKSATCGVTPITTTTTKKNYTESRLWTFAFKQFYIVEPSRQQSKTWVLVWLCRSSMENLSSSYLCPSYTAQIPSAWLPADPSVPGATGHSWGVLSFTLMKRNWTK